MKEIERQIYQLSPETITDLLKKIFKELVELQRSKNQHYKNSCYKRGWEGLFYNIARKWDRFENHCIGDLDRHLWTEIEEDLKDLTIYCALALLYVRKITGKEV